MRAKWPRSNNMWGNKRKIQNVGNDKMYVNEVHRQNGRETNPHQNKDNVGDRKEECLCWAERSREEKTNGWEV